MKDANGLDLYAIAAMLFEKGRWKAEMVYTHARNVTHARYIFRCMHPDPFKAKIEGVGLAIGYHTGDDGKTYTV